jgi:hypothetical protein
MKPAIFLSLFFLSSCSFSHKTGYQTTLKMQLDTIYANDQRYRTFMVLQPGKERDSLAKMMGLKPDEVNEHFSHVQHNLDSINLVLIEHIFIKYGYPGKSMVDSPANEAAYYVIQHSDKISQYFPLIEKAGKAGELSFLLVAMMQDRLLKDGGKEQIYGTQFAGYAEKDSVTGEQKISWFLWPVKDYIHLNETRENAGFTETIEANAASQGIEFRIMTIEELKEKHPGFLPQK